MNFSDFSSQDLARAAGDPKIRALLQQLGRSPDIVAAIRTAAGAGDLAAAGALVQQALGTEPEEAAHGQP